MSPAATTPGRRGADCCQRQFAERVFAELAAAATASRRCPSNEELAAALEVSMGRIAGALTMLVVGRRIAIEIAGRNWRVVTILAGPDSGRRTAPDPRGGAVYRRLDADGDHWLTRAAPP